MYLKPKSPAILQSKLPASQGKFMTNKQSEFKRLAAQAAVEFVEDGMLVGLGHGSTVQFALESIGTRIKSGKLSNIRAIPCSQATKQEAIRLGIPISDFEFNRVIDLTIDGADEIDPEFNLIKGGGGALLREKLVAQESKREIIIADSSKLSAILGSTFKLPIEIAPFGWERQIVYIDQIGGQAIPRKQDNDEFVLSDQGNYILDCDFGPISDPSQLATKLERRAGILEHGLFIGLASDVIIAGPDGVSHQIVPTA
jgi:ribose 5-phosphate isomerase A